MRSARPLALVLMILASSAADQAWAHDGAARLWRLPTTLATASAGELRPLEEILAMLRQRYSGDKLDARVVRDASRVLYEIQWLTADGRKLVILVDATSGQIIETRGQT